MVMMFHWLPLETIVLSLKPLFSKTRLTPRFPPLKSWYWFCTMEIDRKALVVASSIIPLLLESSLELFFNDSIDEHVCEEMDLGTIQVARENFVLASRSQSVVRCTDSWENGSGWVCFAA